MISRMGQCIVPELLISLIGRGIKNREELLRFDFLLMLFDHPLIFWQRARLSASDCNATSSPRTHL